MWPYYKKAKIDLNLVPYNSDISYVKIQSITNNTWEYKLTSFIRN